MQLLRLACAAAMTSMVLGETWMCSQDTIECPDGSRGSRDPNNECKFNCVRTDDGSQDLSIKPGLGPHSSGTKGTKATKKGKAPKKAKATKATKASKGTKKGKGKGKKGQNDENDKSDVVWAGDWDEKKPKLAAAHVLKHHSKAVNACPVHPSGVLAGSASSDGTWALFELNQGKVVTRWAAKDSKEQIGLSCARFHPDGKLYGTANANGLVQIFSLDNADAGPVVAPFEHGSVKINALSFSENGFCLASAGEDGLVKVWDLRKPGAVMAELVCASEKAGATSVSFDFAGSLCAVADSKGGVNVFEKPKKKKDPWQRVVTLQGACKSAITGVAFEPKAKGLWISSMDRSVKLFQ